ncbi:MULTISPECIES: hypothetical protein [Eikenella]|nr:MULTISPECIES: hypothetical protein [Eikenella]
MEHEVTFVVKRGVVAANFGEGFAVQYLRDEFGEAVVSNVSGS